MTSIQNNFKFEKIHFAIIIAVIFIIYLYFSCNFKNTDNFTTTKHQLKPSHVKKTKKTNHVLNRLVTNTQKIVNNAKHFFKIT
jgi:hypothetical protein